MQVTEANTHMADEVNYETHLLTYEDALDRLADSPVYRHIVNIACAVWRNSVQLQNSPEYRQHIATMDAKRAQRSQQPTHSVPEEVVADKEADAST